LESGPSNGLYISSDDAGMSEVLHGRYHAARYRESDIVSLQKSTRVPGDGLFRIAHSSALSNRMETLVADGKTDVYFAKCDRDPCVCSKSD